MILGSYYRLYLWVFFYSFFALMFLAIILDSIHNNGAGAVGSIQHVSDGAGGEAAKPWQFPRFISCLACFACGSLSLVMHHKLSGRAMNVNFLSEESKGWIQKYTKAGRRRKKKAKSSVKIKLFLTHFFSNFVNLIPLFAVAICFLIGEPANKWCNGNTSAGAGAGAGGNSLVDKWFFSIATLMRYAAWYPTMIIAHLFLFPKRKRLKIVV